MFIIIKQNTENGNTDRDPHNDVHYKNNIICIQHASFFRNLKTSENPPTIKNDNVVRNFCIKNEKTAKPLNDIINP
jgi:hypothetical protein